MKHISVAILIFFIASFGYAAQINSTSQMANDAPNIFGKKSQLSVPDMMRTISSPVSGGISYGKSLQCTAYLHIPKYVPKQNDWPVYFYQHGSGVGPSTATFEGFIGPNGAYNNNTTYVLTIDKPGISPDPNDPDKVIVNRDLYDFYTIDTLTECGKNALIWAMGLLDNNPNRAIILQGHSEGAVVMTKLAYNILSDAESIHFQNQLKGLVLSGIPMDDFYRMFHYQLTPEEYRLYLKYYNNGQYTQEGDDYFYNNSLNTNWHWVDNALSKNYVPLTQIFQNISELKLGRDLPIEIFQGLNDKMVSPSSVLKLEDHNNKKLSGQQLSIFARYYNADHEFLNSKGNLDQAAYFDFLNTIESTAKANTK